jgi:phospholipid/cholesterol/gamma-HCH transport system ATP-binding protein
MEAAPAPPPAPEPPRIPTAVVQPPKKLTTKIFKAVGGLIIPNTPGGSPDEPPSHTPTPGLLEEDPLSAERFKTKTRKLLSKRLERSAISKIAPGLVPAIRVTQLDAFYEQQQVLFGLDFSVRRGEILAILGGSGSGKTTLLKHLIGLLRPRGGTIQIGGKDIARLDGDELALVLKSIGMLFQYSALFNSVTVGENVALPLREYTDLPEGAIQAIVRLKLSLVGLPGIENRMPNELSGGMKKRAALARAVALDPDSVFFDEPASGLDPIAAAELDALILHLNRSFGTTMVIVTHDLENAFNVAHRILMLDKGHIVTMGTPAQIQASQDPWVRSFIARKSAARDAIDESFFSRLESRDANLWDTKERKVED